MRAFLLYLAILAPIVLANPAFWAIVGMQVSASPVVYQNHDGSLQPALIGPKSPWPEWAITPDGARLRVKSWFGPSATSKANGMGEIAYDADPRAAAAAYVAKLKDAGWEVETGRFEAAMPVIPPGKLVQCRVRAKLHERVIVAAFEIGPEAGKGTLFWVDAPVPGSWPQPYGVVAGAC